MIELLDVSVNYQTLYLAPGARMSHAQCSTHPLTASVMVKVSQPLPYLLSRVPSSTLSGSWFDSSGGSTCSSSTTRRWLPASRRHVDVHCDWHQRVLTSLLRICIFTEEHQMAKPDCLVLCSRKSSHKSPVTSLTVVAQSVNLHQHVW